MAALAVAASPVLAAAGCGARTGLGAPDGAGGGGGACVETEQGVVTAAIGGPILFQHTECFDLPEGGACPPVEEAAMYIDPACFQVDSIDCGPITKPDACCYVVTEICGIS